MSTTLHIASHSDHFGDYVTGGARGERAGLSVVALQKEVLDNHIILIFYQ